MRLKTSDLKSLTDDELRKRIVEEEENLANLKFRHALSQLENPVKLRLVRKDIARMKTVLRSRELSSQKEQK